MPATILQEEFRPVKSTAAYRVSNLGRVQSCLTRGQRCWYLGHQWRDMKLFPHKDSGYPMADLQIAGERCMSYVHALVLETFVGPRPPGMECCHNDGNPSNCRLDNLRYDTPKNNNADKVRHGTLRIGSKTPQAKLNEEQVLEIVRLARSGMSQSRIAAQIGISSGAVAQIMVGNNWRHLTGITGSAHKTWSKLNEQQVLEIVRLARSGVPYTKIADMIGGISMGAVGMIMSGRNWSRLTGITEAAHGRKHQ